MRFAVVRPHKREIEYVDAQVIGQVYSAAGLDDLHADHGIIVRPDFPHAGIAYAVYEYSMFAESSTQAYFSLGRRLFAGNAVLYGFNEAGDTVDLSASIYPEWYANGHEVEAAIRAGKIDRPSMAIGGNVIWQWPESNPNRKSDT